MSATVSRDAALDELRASIQALCAAERRLRGRDHGADGLSHAHLRALHALSDGELTAGQLARAAELNPASVTAMLDQLESAGIVVRRRPASDRRICLVALSDEGRALVDAKLARWREMWAQALSGYAPAELELATRLTRDVAALLDGITRPAS